MDDTARRILADMLIEAGNSYGEYLQMRLEVTALDRAGNQIAAQKLLSRAESLFLKESRRWLPPLARKHRAALAFDGSGTLMRGLVFKKLEDFRRYVRSGGQTEFTARRLSKLNLVELRLTSSDVMGLAQWTTLTELDLSHNPIGDTGAIALAQSRSLTILKLTNCHIENSGIAALARSEHLRELDLSSHRLSQVYGNGEWDTAPFRTNRNLVRLNLSGTLLAPEVLNHIAQIPTLAHLDLADCGLTHTDLTPLVSTNIQSLNLSSNSLSSQVKVLAKMPVLERLDLSRNYGIGDREARALMKIPSLNVTF